MEAGNPQYMKIHEQETQYFGLQALKGQRLCSKQSTKNLTIIKSALQRDQQFSHGNSKSTVQ